MHALIYAALGLAVIVLLAVLFKMCWRVAEPNQALIISGRKGDEEGMGFRVVTGGGKLVLPGVQVVRRLSLDLNEADLAVDCVTQQGIPVSVRGVVIFKIADDLRSIANAARRFLDQQAQMPAKVHNVFAGHLRSIIGGLTVEELIRDREKLTQQTRTAAGPEMEKLGLTIDSLQIQEIDDPTGYIKNLAAPHAAAVQRDARIAQAQADREATEQEADATARKAEAVRTSEIKQAQFQAEVDQAKAKATQAGPLAEAGARQEVVVQETKVAELEAARREQQLLTEVRKPADAEAYKQVTLSEADRQARINAAEAAARQVELEAGAQAKKTELEAQANATATRLRGESEAAATQVRGEAEGAAIKARGLAEGDAIKAKGLAEGDAIKARSDALAANQEAVIGQQLAEHWPDIVAAGAKAFEAVDNMVVLNGAEGLSGALAQVIGSGAAGLSMVRGILRPADGVTAPPAAADDQQP